MFFSIGEKLLNQTSGHSILSIYPSLFPASPSLSLSLPLASSLHSFSLYLALSHSLSLLSFLFNSRSVFFPPPALSLPLCMCAFFAIIHLTADILASVKAGLELKALAEAVVFCLMAHFIALAPASILLFTHIYR